MPTLTPWYIPAYPREDIRQGVPTDAAEFAVNLEHIRIGQGPEDYVKPAIFFEKTFLTDSLNDLSASVVRRLSGISDQTSAVYNMATQFGGGKTHALATLYHLAKVGDGAKGFQGVDRILTRASVRTIPTANVAVIVGTEFDPLTGRDDGGQLRKTVWGEIAWQLGGRKSYDAIAQHDQQGKAPAGDTIRKMLPEGPTLILMDEVVPLARKCRDAGQGDQLLDFLHSLSEEARAQRQLVLVVSVPQSKVHEITDKDEVDYDRIKHVLNRVAKPVMMAADTEIHEIIRRRLFEWKGLTREAEQTCRAYAEWVRENGGSIAGLTAENALERFRACYPFHPAALSVFERKWASIPRFQRTRGILRMLALWVSKAYRDHSGDRKPEPLLTLGTAPLSDLAFRTAVFEQLGPNELEIPITADIAGRSDANAPRLDREATSDVRKQQLHQKLATAVFFESNGGMVRAEATIGELRADQAGPDTNLADIDHAMESLADSCYYLTAVNNRYRFSQTPNLNKILNDRRSGVQAKQIAEKVEAEIKAVFKARPKDALLDVRHYERGTTDVPNVPVLTIAVLPPTYREDSAATKKLAQQIIMECGNRPREYKSAVIVAVADGESNAIQQYARDLVAWEKINDESDTKSTLDQDGKHRLEFALPRAKKDLSNAVFRAYRHIFLLESDGIVGQLDLGQSTDGTVVENILTYLSRKDLLTSHPSVSTLVKYWPPASIEWTTKGIRDACYQSPLLPRVSRAEALRRTIADGVVQGAWAYFRKLASGRLEPLNRAGTSLNEAEVEISDDVCILRTEDARKLEEPPKLTTLRIEPSQITIASAGDAVLSVSGFDQYGQPFDTFGVVWSVASGLGGKVDQSGRFVASKSPGLFSILATKDGVEARSVIKVGAAKDSENEERNLTPRHGPSSIRWSGIVPPQKWMNFYTKVVGRFANTPGLTISVSFSVPSEAEQSKAKTEETRAALKELGLDDSISHE